MEKSREVTAEPVVWCWAMVWCSMKPSGPGLLLPLSSCPQPSCFWSSPPSLHDCLHSRHHELCPWKLGQSEDWEACAQWDCPSLKKKKKKTNLPGNFILLISALVSLERGVSSGLLRGQGAVVPWPHCCAEQNLRAEGKEDRNKPTTPPSALEKSHMAGHWGILTASTDKRAMECTFAEVQASSTRRQLQPSSAARTQLTPPGFVLSVQHAITMP